ncbi:MAG: tetraacyldisaccharide 4'-kinase [Gemmatimonadota bacterium]
MSAAEWAGAYVSGHAVRGRAAADAALWPAELAYRGVSAARRAAYRRGLLRAHEPPIPVVSIGNLVLGGAGKTPVAAYIVRLLGELGARPALVHGDYARDEPDLHRRWNPDAPVIGDPSRIAAVRRAAQAGADVAVLDDGFQHLALARSLDVVLVPAERWQDAPRLLPRGPWREPPAALSRADFVALTHRGADERALAAARSGVARVIGAPPGGDIVIEPASWSPLGAPDQTTADGPAGPAVAVCAIAHPEGFRSSATAAGCVVAELLGYRDHHEFTERDLDDIVAAASGRPVVTTEKDEGKLARLGQRVPVWVLRERVRVRRGSAALEDLLRRVVG